MRSPTLEKELIQQQNSLSARLFRQVSQSIGDGKSNTVIETLGLATSLMAVAVGAGGQTLIEIDHLVWPNNEVDQVNRVTTFSHLVKDVEEELSLTFKRPADRTLMFLDSNYPPSQNYAKNVERYFDIKPVSVDFATTNVAAQMDKQIEQNTKEAMIVQVPRIQESDAMVILNSSSYMSRWHRSFDASYASKGKFYTADNLSFKTKTMNLTAGLRVGEVPQFSARVLQLPYDGNRHNMYIILPNDKDGLVKLEKDLLDGDFAQNWTLILSQLSNAYVNVKLPRFDVKTMVDMKPILSELGVKSVFDQTKADLTNATAVGGQMSLSAFYHAVHVGVRREGREPAPELSKKAMKSNGVVVQDFVVDHPFLFVISDVRTNLVQVIGRVVEPTRRLKPLQRLASTLKAKPRLGLSNAVAPSAPSEVVKSPEEESNDQNEMLEVKQPEVVNEGQLENPVLEQSPVDSEQISGGLENQVLELSPVENVTVGLDSSDSIDEENILDLLSSSDDKSDVLKTNSLEDDNQLEDMVFRPQIDYEEGSDTTESEEDSVADVLPSSQDEYSDYEQEEERYQEENYTVSETQKDPVSSHSPLQRTACPPGDFFKRYPKAKAAHDVTTLLPAVAALVMGLAINHLNYLATIIFC